MIVDEYRRQRQEFVKLGDLVSTLLKQTLAEAKIDTLAVEHRVKQEASLIGKLERKSDKYRSLEDLTDILGTRVICFFGDDVDRVGKVIEDLLEVDLPDDLVNQIVEGVKAKIKLEKVGDALEALGGLGSLFGKK